MPLNTNILKSICVHIFAQLHGNCQIWFVISSPEVVEIEVTYNPVVNIPTVNMMHAHDSSCRKSIDWKIENWAVLLYHCAIKQINYYLQNLWIQHSCYADVHFSVSVFVIRVEQLPSVWLVIHRMMLLIVIL